MATKQYKVTLTDEVAEFLRAEDSRGRLSEGIDRLVQRVQSVAQPTPQHKAPTKEKTFNPPDDDDDEPAVDPRNPTNNWHIKQKNIREALAAEKAKQAAHDKPRQEFKHCIEHAVIHAEDVAAQIAEYKAMFEDQISADEMQTICGGVSMNHELWPERERMMKYYADSRMETSRRAELEAQGKTEKDIQLDYQQRHGIQAQPPEKQTLRLSVKALKGLGMFGTPESMSDAQITEINAEWANRVDIAEDSDEN